MRAALNFEEVEELGGVPSVWELQGHIVTMMEQVGSGCVGHGHYVAPVLPPIES